MIALVDPFDAGPSVYSPQDACFCAGCQNVELFLAFIADIRHLILCGTIYLHFLCLYVGNIDLCFSRQ